MNRLVKKGLAAVLSGMMVFGLSACGSKDNPGSNKAESGKLTFLIWDSGQKAGMEAIAEAYTKKHPDVEIEVQATGWDEYWTKLEASAQSNSMPDIFWMHSNQIFKYADNEILADCSEIVDESNYSTTAVENAKGSDGKLYGVPKDKFLMRQMWDIRMKTGRGMILKKHLNRFMKQRGNMAIWHMPMTRLVIGILFIKTAVKF